MPFERDEVSATDDTTLSETEAPPIIIPAGETVNELDEIPDITGLDDPALLRYIEDSVYASIITELDSDSFFVENIVAVHASQEYWDTLAFNSQENIYFGYTLSELDAVFQGARYVFTLGDNGQTIVQRFESYDDTFDRVVRNVAIGSGIILVSVTVSVLTGGAAPVVSFIFAASAKSAAGFGVSGAVFSGVIAAVVTGIETNDVDATLKAAALAASEGFMWGAITGTVFGGASAAHALRGATLNGLTMNQAAILQRETGLPLDVIRQFHSMDEAYYLVREVGLRPVMINGKTTLIRGDINMNLVDDFGRTNLQRMNDGLNPIYRDAAGNIRTFEWHHIGQRANGTLALLTQSEHDNPALHGFLAQTEINRTVFAAERAATNRAFISFLQAGG
jgi:hypothetical protein